MMLTILPGRIFYWITIILRLLALDVDFLWHQYGSYVNAYRTCCAFDLIMKLMSSQPTYPCEAKT